jgi:Domain of unknown function (DUF1707)
MDPVRRHYPSGDFRVSDADRDRAVAELSAAFQAGRLAADELDERSGQALAARTGRELTALLADLPVEHVPLARPAGLQRPQRALAHRITIAAAAAATVFAVVAVANAAQTGPTLQQRELMRAMMARQGFSIPLPPAQGFDWIGTAVPAGIAVLFVLLIIFLRVTRAGRG